MPFKPDFTITTKINKALVEIERVRGFLEAVNLKADWVSDMQAKALILESHYSTHIEGTALSLAQAQDILAGKKVKGIDRNDPRFGTLFRAVFCIYIADHMAGSLQIFLHQ